MVRKKKENQIVDNLRSEIVSLTNEVERLRKRAKLFEDSTTASREKVWQLRQELREAKRRISELEVDDAG